MADRSGGQEGSSASVLARFATAVKARRAHTHRLPALFFFTDRARAPDPMAVLARLPRGSGVIFRDYDAPDRAALGATIASACREQGLVFLVAGDRQLARRLRADGLHLREDQIWRRDASVGMMGFGYVTAAAHSAAALQRAGDLGADAAFLSPVFATASHPGGAFLGARAFQQLARTAPLPVYALGGIDGQSLRSLTGLPLDGLAAIGGLGSSRSRQVWRSPNASARAAHPGRRALPADALPPKSEAL